MSQKPTGAVVGVYNEILEMGLSFLSNGHVTETNWSSGGCVNCLPHHSANIIK